MFPEPPNLRRLNRFEVRSWLEPMLPLFTGGVGAAGKWSMTRAAQEGEGARIATSLRLETGSRFGLMRFNAMGGEKERVQGVDPGGEVTE